jgi:hypothetical protein
MADVLWDKAKTLILPFVKDCPWDMAEQTLLLSAREYYRETLTWGMWIDDVFTIANLSDYLVYAGKNVDVVRVLEGSVGTTNYEGANERDFGALSGSSRGNHMAWYDDAIHVYPTPLVDETPIRVFLAVQPSLASTGLPKDQWTKNIDFLAIGALSKLYLTPDRPYTDMAIGAEKKAEFNRHKARARSLVSKGGFAKMRVRAHYI